MLFVCFCPWIEVSTCAVNFQCNIVTMCKCLVQPFPGSFLSVFSVQFFDQVQIGRK